MPIWKPIDVADKTHSASGTMYKGTRAHGTRAHGTRAQAGTAGGVDQR